MSFALTLHTAIKVVNYYGLPLPIPSDPNYKWIATDKSGAIYIYSEEPTHNSHEDFWRNEGLFVREVGNWGPWEDLQGFEDFILTIFEECLEISSLEVFEF